MTTVKLEGVTVLADDVVGLATFYRDALGLTIETQEDHYVAFSGQGIRLAIFSRAGMLANTHDHPDYSRPFTGQAFELNFECADIAEVDTQFTQVLDHGGRLVAQPVRTSWGHYTAFFADPEGNIHSLFAIFSN